jgi:hypothetical protein
MSSGIWNGQPADAGDGNPLWDGSPYQGAKGDKGDAGAPPGIADNAIIRADGSAGGIQGSSVKIDDNGKLYIGASIPETPSAADSAINIDSTALGMAIGAPSIRIQGDNNAERIEIFSSSDVTARGFRYAGSYANKSAINEAGLRLLGIVGAGYTSETTSANSAAVLLQSADVFTPTSAPGEIMFRTTPVDSLAWVDRWRISSAGNLEPIFGGLRIPVETPASSSAAGEQGKLCMDATYLYCWTDTNQCKRIAWTTF